MDINDKTKNNIKPCLNADIMRLRRIALSITVVLAVLCIAIGAVCFYLEMQFTRYTVEAGELISADKIVGIEGAEFGDDFDPQCLNRAGAYYFTVYADGKSITVRLRVKDTKAPEITVKDVYFAVGGQLPVPEDFIESVVEADDFSGEFLSNLPELKGPASHTAEIRFTDASGNTTPIFSVRMTQIYDSEPPSVSVNEPIVAYVGEAVAYREHLTLTDNCIGELSFLVDESELVLDEVGEYNVYITPVDAVGNKGERIAVTVTVLPDNVSREELYALIDDVVDDIIDSDMSPAEICRAIYDYVQDNIIYSAVSRKDDVISEAYRALFISGSGDCFSYYAASKAFLDYLGIENMSVQRARGYTEDTHYWSLVNIGTSDEPLWYHFDCTVLRQDQYSHSGCLLTDEQVAAYSKVREAFYYFNRAKYPATPKEIITPTPTLEPYY